ncbi:hypothetical protein [Kutzneria albida]|uniref:Uncharacterized protein n=1 Tax=Kutzneria albida DSM 43870 TaxID=1449976 RepID=W5WJF9_9PSEU|nr:hypothetical protein [Kutzneria albida]AHH98299.1 hypothetical protein KALB_4937 [Kutzneria albida DSM 43870]
MTPIKPGTARRLGLRDPMRIENCVYRQRWFAPLPKVTFHIDEFNFEAMWDHYFGEVAERDKEQT